MVGLSCLGERRFLSRPRHCTTAQFKNYSNLKLQVCSRDQLAPQNSLATFGKLMETVQKTFLLNRPKPSGGFPRNSMHGRRRGQQNTALSFLPFREASPDNHLTIQATKGLAAPARIASREGQSNGLLRSVNQCARLQAMTAFAGKSHSTAVVCESRSSRLLVSVRCIDPITKTSILVC